MILAWLIRLKDVFEFTYLCLPIPSLSKLKSTCAFGKPEHPLWRVAEEKTLLFQSTSLCIVMINVQVH